MASSSQDMAAELHARIEESPCDPKKIDALLASVGGQERAAAVRSLRGREQRRLWRAVDGYRPLQLIDLVPARVPSLSAVRHFGRNSMPAFSLFEKRFYRDDTADPKAPKRLFGANFQTMSPFTGPGYFVVEAHAGRPELCVDYQRLPPCAPEAWPRIRPNTSGISRLVYGFMLDTLRGVSEHVTIGSAARHGRDIGTFFVLCRDDSAA